MNLDLAKEILDDQLTGPACLSNPNLKHATRLGAEALERVLDVRRFPDLPNWKPLPSE